HRNRAEPVVLIKESSEILFEAATQIFVHSRNRPHLFAMIASAMEQLDLSIQDARLYNSDTGFIFYTFFVLDATGKPIADDVQPHAAPAAIVLDADIGHAAHRHQRDSKPSRSDHPGSTRAARAYRPDLFSLRHSIAERQDHHPRRTRRRRVLYYRYAAATDRRSRTVQRHSDGH